MALPLSYYSVTLADNTTKKNGEPETTSFQVPTITLTPGNVAANVALMGTLASTVAAITLGSFQNNNITYARNLLGVGPAASNLAQRENKWLVRYHDATTYQKFQVSIGTADISLLPDHDEFLDLADAGVGQAFKEAFEAIVVSPANSSNSVVVDSVQFVGRNS